MGKDSREQGPSLLNTTVLYVDRRACSLFLEMVTPTLSASRVVFGVLGNCNLGVGEGGREDGIMPPPRR